MKNEIKSLKTVGVNTPNGLTHAIMIGVDIFDKTKIDEFMPAVIEKFKLQRMISPEDTSLMLITIIGDSTAEEFKKCWKMHIKNDLPAKTFMSKMTTADIIRGTEDGQILKKISLIEV